MSLNNPDSRRALRSVVQAFVALAVVVMAFVVVSKIDSAPELKTLGLAALAIVGLGTVFYGSENIARAIRLRGPLGISAEIDGGNSGPDQPV